MVRVVHAQPTVITFSGSHLLTVGCIARFVPISKGSCDGAAAAVPSSDGYEYGGALDGSLSTKVSLSGGADGTASGVYALCLAEPPLYVPTKGCAEPSGCAALEDRSFTYHPHVTAVVVHSPPSLPPSPPDSAKGAAKGARAGGPPPYVV